MKIALIGYGKTGCQVEIAALERGHEIVQIFDEVNPLAKAKVLSEVEVFIDFSVATQTLANIEIACAVNKPIVIGTTGWLDKIAQAKEVVAATQGAVIYAANFSIGAALFFNISEYAAALLKDFSSYNASIHEAHHTEKKDAPSGTALALKQRIEVYPDLKVTSERIGDVPGTHTLSFDSEVDTIEITHRAKNRKGFAEGAVIAAEWIHGKKGFFTIDDVIRGK